jgi:hypothetical protein
MAIIHNETPTGQPNSSEDTLGDWLINKYNQLKGERTNWDSYWEELSFYIVPRKNNIYGSRSSGEKRGEDLLYDSTSIHANELLASALHSMLTNPSSIWFGLSTGDDDLDMNDDIRKWLDIAVKKMINIFNNTNFNSEVHELYLDLGSFGTATLFIEEDDDNVLRFKAAPIYEHYVEENNKGLVDTIFKEYKWTAKQIVQEFGEKFTPQQVKDAEKTAPTRLFSIIHGVGPRSKRNHRKINSQNKPYYSVHVLLETREVLRNSGYYENPYVIPRWSKVSGEIYGRSPGMKCLADIKMTNAIMKITLQAAQLTIAPPLQAPDDGILLPIKTHPHALNIYRAGSKDRIEPLNTGVKPEFGDEMAAEVRKRINSAFFIDQLQLSEQNPQMTATEVVQRTEEKLRLLGPVLGRQHYEFLQPLVERCFSILLRKGLIPAAPSDLQNKQLNIKYTSQLAKAQRAAEADAFSRTMQVISPIASVDPGVMDNFDGDEIARYAADIFNLPPKLLKDKARVKTERQAKLEQSQAQQQMQQQMAGAEALQKGASGVESLAKAQTPPGM